MAFTREASFYQKLGTKKVQCLLCPQNCIIGPEKTGLCKVRRNSNGVLLSENYGMISAKHSDPIEKKPLYHFFPGKEIFSIGTVGCNMHCLFCQNSEISQTCVLEAGFLKYIKPEDIIKEAQSISKNIGIAYTYNEPGIWIEYILDVAKLAKKAGMYNVIVSNGFINEIPRRELFEVIDAFNIDLKGFTDDFYKIQTFSSLAPVKDSIKEISLAEKHLEITNLVIPLLNDDPIKFEEMAQWIANETGPETVLHLSRYFPSFKKSLPVTPVNKLEEFYYTAKKYLYHVYIGNVRDCSKGRDTICPGCKSIVIDREGYHTAVTGLDQKGNCKKCGYQVINPDYS